MNNLDPTILIPSIYFNYHGHKISMIGKCDDCGIDNVEIMVITKENNDQKSCVDVLQ